MAIRKFFIGATDNEDMIKTLRAFVVDKTAATAIEYALIAGGISIVIITAVDSVGTVLNGIFGKISASMA